MTGPPAMPAWISSGSSISSAMRARCTTAQTSCSKSTATNIAPSPSHFAMRTPKSVATRRAALRKRVRTRTDSSSPFSSLKDVKPDKSTKANARSTRTTTCSHPGETPDDLCVARRSRRVPLQALHPVDDGDGDVREHVGLAVSARLERFETVIPSVDPVELDPPADAACVPLELLRGAERVTGAGHEQRRHVQPREVVDTQLFGLARRVQRIPQQNEPERGQRIGLGTDGQRAHPSAHRTSAEHDPVGRHARLL